MNSFLVRLTKYIIPFITVAPAYAQLDFDATKFTQKEGLSSYNIKSIAQDKYGFIWLGTQDGLYFFNGRDFKLIFNQASANSAKDVKKIVYDSVANCIWVAYSAGGLEAFDCGQHVLKKSVWMTSGAKKSPIEGIEDMILLKDHRLVVSFGHGLITISPDQDAPVINISAEKISETPKVLYLGQFQNQTLVTFANKGLFHYNTIEKKAGACLFGYKAANPVTYLDGENYYCLQDNAIIRYNINTHSKSVIPCSLPVSCINKFAGDSIFLSTSEGNYVADFETGETVPVNLYAGGKLEVRDYVITTIWDKEGNLWIGNSKSLQSSRLNKPSFFSFSNQSYDLASISHLFQIAPVDGSHLLLGDISGCYYYNKNANTLKLLFDRTNTFHLRASKNGDVFYSAAQHLTVLKRKDKTFKKYVIEQQYPEWRSYAKEDYTGSLDVSDSTSVFLSTRGPIVLWDRIKRRCRKIETDSNSGWAGGSIFSATVLDTDRILFCQKDGIVTYNSSTGYAQPHSFTHPKTHEKITYLFDAIVAGNQIWIATYGFGIIITDLNFQIMEVIDIGKGLSHNGVYRLINDSLGNIWCSTNNGLNRINIATKNISSYYSEDGTHGNQFEQYCAGTYGGNLYFGGVDGFTLVSPKNQKESWVRPQIYIDRIELISNVKTETVTDIASSRCVVPNNIIQTNILLLCNDLVSQKRNRFLYFISGHHKNWLPLGTENEVSILGLQPGKYWLNIRVVNIDNNLYDEKKVLLIIQPKWYQTDIFKFAIICLGVGFLSFIYFYRITQLKRQHDIRRAIASDLHDDLGSTLNSVKVFASLAASGIKIEDNLRLVKSNLDTAMTALRDMIWVLDDSRDTVDDLVTRLNHYFLPVASATGTKAVIKSDSECLFLTLTKEEKRNFYLICKEALNNAVKYASPSEITVLFRPSKNKAAIIITDDGAGFNIEVAKKGYGLKNMESRAKQVKYTFSLQSKEGSGTSIIITPS